SADETSDAVVLPPGRLDDIGDGGAIFPAQKFENHLLLRAASFPLRLGFTFGRSLVPLLGRLRGGLCCFGLLCATLRFQRGFVRGGAFCSGYICAHRRFLSRG